MKAAEETQKKTLALETALAIVFGLLLVGTIYEIETLFTIALVLSILPLLWLWPFRWLSKAWFALGHFLGFFVSTLILSLIYFVVISPMGFLYRTFTKNPLKIQPEAKTLFDDRDHKFQPSDLDKIF